MANFDPSDLFEGPNGSLYNRLSSDDEKVTLAEGDIGEVTLVHPHTGSVLYRELYPKSFDGARRLMTYLPSPSHGLSPVEIGVINGGDFTFLHNGERKSATVPTEVLDKNLANWRDITRPESLIFVRSESSVENVAVLAQSNFGFGSEARGPLVLAVKEPTEVLTSDALRPDMRGKIVVGGASLDLETLERAIELGIIGLVVGRVDHKHIETLLGRDGKRKWKCEDDLGLTILATEGYLFAGHAEMGSVTFDLLKQYEGREIFLNGATQVGAEIIGPRLVVAPDIGRVRSPEENYYFLPRALYGKYMEGKRRFPDWDLTRLASEAWTEHRFAHDLKFIKDPISRATLDRVILAVDKEYQRQEAAYQKAVTLSDSHASLGLLASNAVVDTISGPQVSVLNLDYIENELMASAQPRAFPKIMGDLGRFANDVSWGAEGGFVHSWLVDGMLRALLSDPEDPYVVKVGNDRRKGLARLKDRRTKEYLFDLNKEVSFKNHVDYMMFRAEYSYHRIVQTSAREYIGKPLRKRLPAEGPDVALKSLSLFEAFPSILDFFEWSVMANESYLVGQDSKIEGYLHEINVDISFHQQDQMNVIADYNIESKAGKFLDHLEDLSLSIREDPSILKEKWILPDGRESSPWAYVNFVFWQEVKPFFQMTREGSLLDFPQEGAIWRILGYTNQVGRTDADFHYMVQSMLYRIHPCHVQKSKAGATHRPVRWEIDPSSFDCGFFPRVLDAWHKRHIGLSIPSFSGNVLAASLGELQVQFPVELWDDTAYKLYRAAKSWGNDPRDRKSTDVSDFVNFALPLPKEKPFSVSPKFCSDKDVTEADVNEMCDSHFANQERHRQRTHQLRTMLMSRNPVVVSNLSKMACRSPINRLLKEGELMEPSLQGKRQDDKL